MSKKLKIRLTFLTGLLSWLLFSFFDIYFILLKRYEIEEAYIEVVPQVFLTLFILSTLGYYRYMITKAESINFIDLLWRVFITGLITTMISLSLRFVFTLFAATSFIQNPLTVNFFYHIYVALVVIFLVSTFVVWKRLILYQKSKKLIQWWTAFEYTLVASLLFDFFGFETFAVPFNVLVVAIAVFSLILSLNLKWIAYLNFKQKWKSILFILLSGIYLYHFVLNLSIYSDTGVLVYDLFNRVFIISLFFFILIYAVIAVLVTLFNLPTSSVFERKLQEAVDFQKLSQSSPSGQSEEETYDILIDSAMSAVFADAAWLEIKKGDDKLETIRRNLNREEVGQIKILLRDSPLSDTIYLTASAKVLPSKSYTTLAKGDYRSAFAIPIFVKNEQVGSLVLLQSVADAFDREMMNIITTFVNQASVSIENARLLNDAIENERYKEQLKIAKAVQKSLLPSKLISNSAINISAYAMAADEVGGDYYDVLSSDEHIHKIIIGDVSGKGTSAAFNMAQMKGIFHSLALIDLKPDALILKANAALSNCLEKSSFITATYLEINTRLREIEFVRAGHCPTLYYRASDKSANYLSTKGMGLGIVRNSEYAKYVHCNALKYEPGDLILLYTDGITEACDATGDQFGENRLKEALTKNIHSIDNNSSIENIKNGIIEELYAFLNGKKLDDDYTLMLIKFEA
ncbi:MAG: sigma-B regulation protein RsbU (phosphoserine phosphatase) [Cyclobacteriaceae bacterium]|jgi:sigma-B regulation protein RsbU (phosphoserine phosphatase)